MAKRRKSLSSRAQRHAPRNSASRPLWRGHLKLSLVSCPIALYNAISEAEDIHLNFLNPDTGNRIRYQAIDAETEDVLERSDLVRGYQFQKDRYVTLTEEELDDLKIESSSIINIEQFVPQAEIPPLYFERVYYAVPDGEAGLEAYTVIREAVEKSGMFAIGRAVISRKERVIALQPSGKGLVGYALREESDIRPAADFFDTIETAKVDRDALSIAMKLVEQKTRAFNSAEYEDRYEARLRQLIQAKLKGVELEPEEIEEAPNVINLMDALKRSLGEGGGKRSAGRDAGRSATVHRLPTRKKAAARKAARSKAAAKTKSRKRA